MARAKYGTDPRPCPSCGKKSLYVRVVCIGLPGQQEPESVYADRCNKCHREFFEGRIMREGDPRQRPSPEQIYVRVQCLLHNAAVIENEAQSRFNEAKRMREVAAALGHKEAS